MQDKALVVMAAGMGSRFGGLKQIEPVGPNGEFIIDYSVYDAKRAGFTKVVFVIKKELEEVFRNTIGKRCEKFIETSYVFQEISDIPDKKYLAQKREKPWGTLQAVLCSKNEVKGSFLVINADDFYGYDSYLKASKFLDSKTDENVYASINFPYIVTSSKFGSVKRAVVFSENNVVNRLVESKMTSMDSYALCEPLDGSEAFSVPLDQPVAVNCFAFKHSLFAYLEEYFNNFFRQDDEVILESEALLPELIKEKAMNKEIILKNIVSDSTYLGMTYKDDLKDVKFKINKLIEKGEYPRNLWE